MTGFLYSLDNTNCNEITTAIVMNGHADCAMKNEGQIPATYLRLS